MSSLSNISKAAQIFQPATIEGTILSSSCIPKYFAEAWLHKDFRSEKKNPVSIFHTEEKLLEDTFKNRLQIETEKRLYDFGKKIIQNGIQYTKVRFFSDPLELTHAVKRFIGILIFLAEGSREETAALIDINNIEKTLDVLHSVFRKKIVGIDSFLKSLRNDSASSKISYALELSKIILTKQGRVNFGLIDYVMDSQTKKTVLRRALQELEDSPNRQEILFTLPIPTHFLALSLLQMTLGLTKEQIPTKREAQIAVLAAYLSPPSQTLVKQRPFHREKFLTDMHQFFSTGQFTTFRKGKEYVIVPMLNLNQDSCQTEWRFNEMGKIKESYEDLFKTIEMQAVWLQLNYSQKELYSKALQALYNKKEIDSEGYISVVPAKIISALVRQNEVPLTREQGRDIKNLALTAFQSIETSPLLQLWEALFLNDLPQGRRSSVLQNKIARLAALALNKILPKRTFALDADRERFYFLFKNVFRSGTFIHRDFAEEGHPYILEEIFKGSVTTAFQQIKTPIDFRCLIYHRLKDIKKFFKRQKEKNMVNVTKAIISLFERNYPMFLEKIFLLYNPGCTYFSMDQWHKFEELPFKYRVNRRYLQVSPKANKVIKSFFSNVSDPIEKAFEKLLQKRVVDPGMALAYMRVNVRLRRWIISQVSRKFIPSELKEIFIRKLHEIPKSAKSISQFLQQVEKVLYQFKKSLTEYEKSEISRELQDIVFNFKHLKQVNEISKKAYVLMKKRINPIESLTFVCYFNPISKSKQLGILDSGKIIPLNRNEWPYYLKLKS